MKWEAEAKAWTHLVKCGPPTYSTRQGSWGGSNQKQQVVVCKINTKLWLRTLPAPWAKNRQEGCFSTLVFVVVVVFTVAETLSHRKIIKLKDCKQAGWPPIWKRCMRFTKVTSDSEFLLHINTLLTRSSQRGAWSVCKWAICQEAVYIPSPTPLFNTSALKGKSFLISCGLSYF